MLKFHAVGDWQPGQVSARVVACTRLILPEVEQMIEEAWQAALHRRGLRLFDGPMCRLEAWEASAQELRLALSETSYKPFVGTNLTNPDLAERYGPQVMANPVGVSPALHTADGYLMLGRRNGSVAYYPNRAHPFAGALEPRDGGDVFRAVRRELAEELSLADANVPQLRCVGLVEDRALRQPELIFLAETTRTRSEIEAQVHREEHGDSMAVETTKEAIARAIGDPALTPVAAASLLLWGRATWGEKWFSAQAERGAGD